MWCHPWVQLVIGWRLPAFQIAAIVALSVFYKQQLQAYLSGLDQPAFLYTAFLGLYAFRFGQCLIGSVDPRLGRLTHLVLFACKYAVAICLAGEFRALYGDLVANFPTDRQFIDSIGQDVYEAAKNRAVGYGGAFSAGLLVSHCIVSLMMGFANFIKGIEAAPTR